jgi:hypothetical protein
VEEKTMLLYKAFHRVLPVSAVALFLQMASVSHGGTCNLDVPLQWTLSPSYLDGTAAAITGDGLPYVNGQSGVSGTIKVCDGTNDAVLSNSSRTISFSFAKMLASSSNTPSWASSGGRVTGTGLLNIRNITFLPPGHTPAYTREDEYTFTTRMGSNLPVKGFWNFRIFDPTTDAASDDSPAVSTNNTPYLNSPVIAHHCPAHSTATAGPCVGVTHETWFVYPDTAVTQSGPSQTGLPLTQVGALVNTQKATVLNAGEFSMPFYFVISALQ